MPAASPILVLEGWELGNGETEAEEEPEDEAEDCPVGVLCAVDGIGLPKFDLEGLAPVAAGGEYDVAVE